MEVVGNAVKFIVKTVVFIAAWHIIGNAVAEVAAERREQKRKQEEANA